MIIKVILTGSGFFPGLVNSGQTRTGNWKKEETILVRGSELYLVSTVFGDQV